MFHGGGIAGIGSHQYIHNTPADYRYGIKRPPLTVSDTSFYTYSDLELASLNSATWQPSLFLVLTEDMMSLTPWSNGA